MTATMMVEAAAVLTGDAPDDIMLACDDLYCDPFDAAARDRVHTLLIQAGGSQPGSPVAGRVYRASRDGNAATTRYLSSRGAAVATTARSDNDSANRAKGEHAMSPSTSHQLPSVDDDYAVVRQFSRELKIACDELHDDPFDNVAREALRTLLAEGGPVADEALHRLTAQSAIDQKG